LPLTQPQRIPQHMVVVQGTNTQNARYGPQAEEQIIVWLVVPVTGVKTPDALPGITHYHAGILLIIYTTNAAARASDGHPRLACLSQLTSQAVYAFAFFSFHHSATNHRPHQGALA
jgi:hypothetical protein